MSSSGESQTTPADGMMTSIKKLTAGPNIVIIVLFVVIISVAYCKKDTFVGADGVVARKSSGMGVRSDTEVDRTWNVAELEKSVALLNRKSGAYA